MESKSRKLSIEELYMLKWLVGSLTGLIAVSTLFNLNGHNLIPARAALIFIGCCILLPKLYVSIPSWGWKVYAVSIIPLLAIDILAKETAPAMMNLNTWLIIYRSVNHNSRREEMQLVLLSLFLMVMVGILTSTIVFGFQLLVFAGLATAFLVIGSILECRNEGRPTQSFHFKHWLKSFSWFELSKVIQWRPALQGSLLFLALISIAGASFLVIPRIDIENKVTLFEMAPRATQTGFSDTISLGEVTDIKKNNGVALRVDVESQSLAPSVPYWRMLALDEYYEGRFALSEGLKQYMNGASASPHHARRYWSKKEFSNAPSDKVTDRWTFFLEPGVSRYLPIAGTFTQLTTPHLSDLSVVPQMHVFSMKKPSSKMLSYQLENVDFSGTIPGTAFDESTVLLDNFVYSESSPSNQYPNTLLKLPADQESRRYLSEVVSELIGDDELSAAQFADRAIQYLSKTHRYSMQVALPQAQGISDPVIRWLQSDLPGHCEFFASSFILLSRAAGYPARAAVGFKGGTWNAYEQYFMVRNADAHAWAEIYDGNGSWLRVDPTPGSPSPTTRPDLVAVAEQPSESGSFAYMDSLRMLWYRRIVNFDESAQKEFAVQLREFFTAYLNVAELWATHAIFYIYDWARSPWNVWRILYMVTLGLILLAALVIQRNLALNFREMIVASFRRDDPIRRKASKLLRRVEQAFKKDGASIQKDWDGVIASLRRLRFGAKESWPNPRLVFKEARRLL